MRLDLCEKKDKHRGGLALEAAESEYIVLQRVTVVCKTSQFAGTCTDYGWTIVSCHVESRYASACRFANPRQL